MNEATINTLNALVGAWQQTSKDAGLERAACILATRSAVATLRYFGIEARAMPVQLVVQNRKLADQVDAGIADIDWSQGAYGVGVDPDRDASHVEGWNGHLIAWIPQAKAFVDLTLDQFSRPDYDINVRPLVAGFDDFLSGQWATYEANDCRMMYRYRPDLGREWRDSVDGKCNIEPLAGATIRTMRKILSATNGQ